MTFFFRSDKILNCYIILICLCIIYKLNFKGHPRLVHALSALYSKLINRKIDPMNEILVTSGAYEALYSTIQGYVYSHFQCIYSICSSCHLHRMAISLGMLMKVMKLLLLNHFLIAMNRWLSRLAVFHVSFHFVW